MTQFSGQPFGSGNTNGNLEAANPNYSQVNQFIGWLVVLYLFEI